MNIEKHADYLEMTADHLERDDIARLISEFDSPLTAESFFIAEFLDGEFEQVAPEEVGALTSAPLISDGETVYGYMDYQVHSLLEELRDGKTVRWQAG